MEGYVEGVLEFFDGLGLEFEGFAGFPEAGPVLGGGVPAARNFAQVELGDEPGPVGLAGEFVGQDQGPVDELVPGWRLGSHWVCSFGGVFAAVRAG
jgi:hypothetical protein